MPADTLTDATIAFINRLQAVTGQWCPLSLPANVGSLWRCLRQTPTVSAPAERFAIAMAVVSVASMVFQRTPGFADRHTRPADASAARWAWLFVSRLRSVHTEQGTTLRSVARRLGVSHCYLSRQISAHTGCTFHVHLAGWRVLHASLSLLGPWQIKAIAYRLGYRGTSEFDRQFHRWLRMTPGEYRRALRTATATKPFALVAAERSIGARTLATSMFLEDDRRVLRFRG